MNNHSHSGTSSERKKLSSIFLKEDNINKFIAFEHSHRQISFHVKSFKTINNKELNKILEELLEKESNDCKKNYPDREFSVEAIIEGGYFQSKKSKTDSNSVDNQISERDEFSDKHFRFNIITSIFFYDFDFNITTSKLKCNKKINLTNIEFFSITQDYSRLIIHIKSSTENSNCNIGISNDNAIQIAFCIGNILFYCYSMMKVLVVIPKLSSFYEKIKNIDDYEKFKGIYNSYALEIFNKISEAIPRDKDENIIKMIPLSKLEAKFTDIKTDKIIILTNKKILEISHDNNYNLENSFSKENSKIKIISLSKMKRINEFNKKNKFQIILNDMNTIFTYSTLYYKVLIRLIKTAHSKECLLDLEIEKID